jgi:hypothetical protein
MKTFAEFMKTGAANDICDAAFLERLAASGITVTSVNELVKFARDRYPDHYPADIRKSSSMPFGRLTMQRLWATYLSWVEAPEKTAKKGGGAS